VNVLVLALSLHLCSGFVARVRNDGSGFSSPHGLVNQEYAHTTEPLADPITVGHEHHHVLHPPQFSDAHAVDDSNDDLRHPLVPDDGHFRNLCTDTSYCGPVQWAKELRHACFTTWKKECVGRKDTVCEDLTEIDCETVPYTECKFYSKVQIGKRPKFVWKEYENCTCGTHFEERFHVKQTTRCEDETKYDCTTEWSRDPNTGADIWTKGDCKPVTWKNCTVVPVEVPYLIPNVTCRTANLVPYLTFRNETFKQSTGYNKCVAKSSRNCTPKTRKECKKIDWEECDFVPVTRCQHEHVHVPYQEWVHSKKCLFSDDVEDTVIDHTHLDTTVTGSRQIAIDAGNIRDYPNLSHDDFLNLDSKRTDNIHGFSHESHVDHGDHVHYDDQFADQVDRLRNLPGYGQTLQAAVHIADHETEGKSHHKK